MNASDRRTLIALSVLAAALFSGACGDDSPAPAPGTVTVTLVSPNGSEGAAVFRVTGETVTSADTDAGRVFVRQAGAASTIVLVREPAGELRFRMDVEDVHRPPEVEIVEVAGPDDAVRASLAGYGVEVER